MQCEDISLAREREAYLDPSEELEGTDILLLPTFG